MIEELQDYSPEVSSKNDEKTTYLLFSSNRSQKIRIIKVSVKTQGHEDIYEVIPKFKIINLGSPLGDH